MAHVTDTNRKIGPKLKSLWTKIAAKIVSRRQKVEGLKTLHTQTDKQDS